MKMTSSLKEVLYASRKVAIEKSDNQVSVYHFLIVCGSEMASTRGLLPYAALKECNCIETLTNQCEKIAHSVYGSKKFIRNPSQSSSIKFMLEKARKIARSFKHNNVCVEHAFLASLENLGVQRLDSIVRYSQELNDLIYSYLGIPTDKQTKDIERVREYMNDLSPQGKLVDIQIGWRLAVCGPARMCACILAADNGKCIDLDYCLWLIEHTKHLESKKSKMSRVRSDNKRGVDISSTISAGKANELSLLSRLDPPMRKRVRARLDK